MSRRPLSTLPIPRTTLAALLRVGYETVQDVAFSSAEALSKELRLPLPECQSILDAASTVPGPSQRPLSIQSQRPQATYGGTGPEPAAPAPSLTLTQTVASLATATNHARFASGAAPLDSLLGGGLQRGHILELSGPPGCMKEALAMDIVTSFVRAGEGALVVDTQNMMTASDVRRALQRTTGLPPDYEKLVHRTSAHTLSELMALLHTLPSFLDSHPDIRLLAIASISFPFQLPLGPESNPLINAGRPGEKKGSGPSAVNAVKNGCLERLKQGLTRLSAARALTIVLTSQLATKLINADGTRGNFDTGSRAVMVPALGPSYLPSGRAHRIVVIPNSRTSGVLRILSSPTYMPGKGVASPEASYELAVEGGAVRMHSPHS